MIPVKDLPVSTMIAAASRRAIVQLDTGAIARLIGWNVRGGSERARVEMSAGVSRTIKCSRVVAVRPPEIFVEISPASVDN